MKIRNSDGEILKAGGVVLNEKNEVLLISSLNKNVWSYPKGHLELGETNSEAAKREILEETGYEVNIERQLSDIVYLNQETQDKIRIAMYLVRPVIRKNEGESEVVKKWFLLKDAIKVLPGNLSFLLDDII
jgi:ADP-ribose pyrophosphatase YjhB (NUDIX family)